MNNAKLPDRDKFTLSTVVTPNKGTPKFSEIGSNKGIFPLFGQFPYLKNFPEIPEKKTKLCVEGSFSARSCYEYLRNLLFTVF